MRSMQRKLIILGVAFVGASHAQIPGQVATPLATMSTPEVVLVDIALAYSTDGPDGAIEVEPWDESGASVGDSLGARIDYFTVVPTTIRLGIGGYLDLEHLRIHTHGLNGEPVARAPLKLSLEVPAGLLDLEHASNGQRLLATSPGFGRLWIESLLPRGTGTGERYRLPIVLVVR